jgi:murein DD-endopeptidase MepM/ murein hydrolase activator NlpD
MSASVNGGAAAGVAPATPPSTATAARTGGAVPGQRPERKVMPRPAKPTPAKPAPAKPAPKPAPQGSTIAGVFPVVGPFSFGGADARFGAQRNGHIHQGQDVIAASGTPIVAPLPGTILWKANQPAGAGIYVILHGGDGRDYAFMHIKRGTTLVTVGDAVRQGQQLAQVGATGDATGPHLHFEIWVGGWGTKTGQPVDPLPQLKRWAGL